MRTPVILAYLTPLFTLLHAQTCSVFMPYSNMQYLSPALLSLYNLTDPCTVTCNSGFYGDSCTSLPLEVPSGPWNQAGYYLAGPALLRSLTLDVSRMSQVQFAGGSLFALSNSQLSSAQVVLISLGARTATPILSSPALGSLDALVVRGGVVYVSRSLSSSGPYDILALNPSLSPTATRLMNVSSKALFLEVFVDKGMVTVFIASANQLLACYPSNKCTVLGTYPGITGIFCSLDCPSFLYFSQSNYLYKIPNAQGATPSSVVTEASPIHCLSGDKRLHAILYLGGAGLRQVSLQTNRSTGLATGLFGKPFCSVDISDSYSQILIAQSGTITTLDAFQQACGYGQTSPALYANSSTLCNPCPAQPENAYFLQGSASCEWRCNAGYTQAGSLCSPTHAHPCPEHYRTSVDGACVPSLQPWAGAGAYVSSVTVNYPLQWPQFVNPYLLASNGSSLFMAVSGGLYYSLNSGSSWSTLNAIRGSSGICAASVNRAYNFLALQGPFLWAGFVTPQASQSVHCLWALAVSGATATMVQSWTIGGQVCSISGGQNLTSVYAVFCRSSYIAQLPGASPPVPLAGGARGYNDGSLLESAFDSLSGMAAYLSRIYIADTGNCVIREVDPVRGRVSTVAGSPGICQRADGVRGGLAYPSNLTHSAYPGFFLFLDKYPTESLPVLRQFHAPTGTVQTIATAPVSLNWLTYIVGLPDQIIVGQSSLYGRIASTPQPCPGGYTAPPGGAFSAAECTACASGYYSSAGGCFPCSSPRCDAPGQALTPCQSDSDAYCSTCTNKPPGKTQYTGPSTVPANATGGGGDCPWAYVPPCPIGYYQEGSLCVACPLWSTTLAEDSKSLSQCVCVGGGTGSNGACVVPSPFSQQPEVLGPLDPRPPSTDPSFPFPLLDTCPYGMEDSPQQVCPCGPGEYIHQVFPKVCLPCPSGLYSPKGRQCLNCPYFMEPTRDKASCQCAAGSWNSVPASETPVCVCGAGAMLRGGCTPCPENTFSSEAVPAVEGATSQCLACPAGKTSTEGSSECTDCGPGQYREATDAWCTSCDMAFYAPDPTIAFCETCVSDCGGRKEARCPTDPTLVSCSACDAPRPNSKFNGGLDCATECLDGFYELDGECAPCDAYDAESCPAGNLYVACGAYSNSGCVPCVNSTKPLNYAEWEYAPESGGGPNARCEWKCVNGYIPKETFLAGGWECREPDALSFWDIFAI